MCEGAVVGVGLVERAFKRLTIGELKRLGFERVVDLSGRSTTLQRKAPFFWAYPEVLEECEDDLSLLEAMERPQTDGEFFFVVANGVLGEGDVFPFAVFTVEVPQKPVERSTAGVREMAVREDLREQFEAGVFSARFIGSIQRTGKGGPMELMSVDCPTKAELMRRSEVGDDYVDESVSAMWFGFKLALREACDRWSK